MKCKYALFILIIVYVLLALVIASTASGETNRILSDYDFTNRSQYGTMDYIRAFGQDYPTNDIRYAVEIFSNTGLNPLLFFLTAWKEGRPRDSWMLGCGSHLKWKTIEAFEPQVRSCARTWRGHFDQAPANGYEVFLYERGKMKIKNRSTYALYKYTPFINIRPDGDNIFMATGMGIGALKICGDG